MCGIAGIASRRLAGSGDLRPAIGEMLRLMRHRGPDGHGVFVDGAIGLGSDRLAIVDLRPLEMPLATADGRFVIAYNGEVYNHRELRDELASKGVAFATATDTEVVAEAYRAWGPDCVERLQGMFAFVVLDRAERRLFGARDRLGKKPLFVHESGDLFAFASFLPAFDAVPGLATSPDPRAMLDLVEHGWVHGPRTALREIRQVPPAHRFTWEAGRLRMEPYWDLAEHFRAGPGLSPGEVETSARDLEPLLADAVRRRLVADVPLGAFLSGGIDSSIVVALMRESSPDPPRTFTVAFDVPGFDESAHAAAVAAHVGTQHHVSTMRLDDPSLLDVVQRRMGEPLADTSVLPTFLVAEIARREVKVALSGDGADELFAGYQTYRADRLHRMLRALPAGLVQPPARLLAGLLPVDHGKISVAYRARRFASGLGLPPIEAHAHWRALRSHAEACEALTAQARRELGGHEPVERFRELERRVAGCDAVNRASYVDLCTYLPDDILVKVDRATMGHSLEARCPFLDHRVVELVARLPGRMKLRGFTSKWLLRRQHAHRLPEATLRRSKEGFSSPVARWLTGSMRERFLDLVVPARLEPLGIDAAKARRLHADLEARRGFHAFALWAVVAIASWDEQRRRA